MPRSKKRTLNSNGRTPRRPWTTAVNRAALSRRHEGRVLINRDCFGNRSLAQTTCADRAGSSGDFLKASPPAEKTTAREKQPRQACTGARNSTRARDSIVETEPSSAADRFAK
jgi:hypothetical protein